MNRDDRRKQAARVSREKHVRKLVERAEKEGYVIYSTTFEQAQKLAEIHHRILSGLDDISCWDGLSVLMTMTAMVAACGAHNKVDSLEIMKREIFLKNCAEKYDHYAKWHAEQLTKVNTEGGDA